METRATLKPADRGTRKLVKRFGRRLVCVSYRYAPFEDRVVATQPRSI